MTEWALMHGDSLATLRGIPSGAASIMITDPPFVLAGSSTNGRSGGHSADGQFFRHWFTDILSECWRILGSDGCALICCDWRTLHEVRLCARAPGVTQTAKTWEVTQALCWDRGSFGLGSPFRNQFEMMAFVRGPNWDRADRPRNVSNVIRERWPYGQHALHPAEKPVELFRPLIDFLAPEGATVLDPFAGSGSIGVASAMEGRDYLGIEVDDHAIETARRRMLAAGAHEVEPPCRPQLGLFADQ